MALQDAGSIPAASTILILYDSPVRHLLFPPLLTLCGLALSCSVSPTQAIQDLAAIHDPIDWSPQSPAFLSVAPDVYLSQKPARGAKEGAKEYTVLNHTALEREILQTISRAVGGDMGQQLEAVAWVSIELLHDDHPAARIHSAAILSTFAVHWIQGNGVKLSPEQTTGDFTQALSMYQEADAGRQTEDLIDALEQLVQAKLPTPLASIRALTALGRRTHANPVQKPQEQQLRSFALRVVFQILEQGAKDVDAEVRTACSQRLQILRSLIQLPAP